MTDDWTEQEINEKANTLPPYVPPLPGIEPISQGPHLFDTEHEARFGMSLARAAVAGTAAAMIAAAVALLGMGEHPTNHNAVTVEYNQKVARIGDGPWCDMGITVEAIHSGNIDAVCGGPRRGFAYTIAHAQDFKRRGLWHYGLKDVRPGDIVFFSWSRGKSIDDIEHVGIVEHRYDDGTVATIECNISDMCRREHRDATYVVGYGRPPYNAQKQEDDMPGYVSLGLSKPAKVTAGKAIYVQFDRENSDAGDQHAKGPHPGLIRAGKKGTLFNTEVKLTGPAGTYKLVETDPAKDYAESKSDYAEIAIGDPHAYVGLCDADQHLYLKVMPKADGEVSIDYMKTLYWDR